MSAPRWGEPSTFEKVLGASVVAGGILLLALGTGAATVATIYRDRHAAFGDLLLIALGSLFLCMAAAFFGEALDSLSWSAVLRDARALFCGKDRVDLGSLPRDIAEAIRPLMGRIRRLTCAEIRELLAEATSLMEEHERYARAERDALEREMEFEQSRAAAAHLRKLSDEEKALLELSMHIRADADARAARDFERLVRELAALRDACARLSQFHFYNNQHKG